MPDTKISLLPAASSLGGPEIVPAVQGGVTVKTTLTDIAAFAGVGRTVTSTKTANYTALTYQIIPINSSGGPFSINLPTVPGEVDVVDVTGGTKTNPVTLIRASGQTIDGLSQNFTIADGRGWRGVLAGTTWRTLLTYAVMDTGTPTNPQPTGITSGSGTSIQLADNSADNATITTLSLTGGSPVGTGTWSIAAGSWSKTELSTTSGVTTVLRVNDADGLAAADQGAKTVTVEYSGEQGSGVLSIVLSITVYAAGTSTYQRPYGPNAPWNIPVAGLAIDTAVSADYAAKLYAQPERDGYFYCTFNEYTYAVRRYTDANADYTIQVTHDDWGNVTDGTVFRWNTSWNVQGGTDRQTIILDPATGREWDLWEVSVNHTSRVLTAGSAALVPGNYWTKEDGYPPPRGVGIQTFAMLVVPEEIEAGVIEHALSMPIVNPHNSIYVAPATKLEGHPNALSTGIPEGTRFFLDVTLQEIEDWLTALPAGVPAAGKNTARIIVRAMRDYGFFVTDGGGAVHFQFEDRISGGTKWNNLGMAEQTIGGKVWPDEMFDMAPLITTARLKVIVPSDQYAAGGGGGPATPINILSYAGSNQGPTASSFSVTHTPDATADAVIIAITTRRPSTNTPGLTVTYGGVAVTMLYSTMSQAGTADDIISWVGVIRNPAKPGPNTISITSTVSIPGCYIDMFACSQVTAAVSVGASAFQLKAGSAQATVSLTANIQASGSMLLTILGINASTTLSSFSPASGWLARHTGTSGTTALVTKTTRTIISSAAGNVTTSATFAVSDQQIGGILLEIKP